MALIQCLLGAASPVLSSQTYCFERDAHGRFVCEVFDLVHIQCLLSRDDIYKEVKLIADKPIEAHIETLLGSSVLPSMILIAEGLEVQLGAVVMRAHQESGLSIEDWNALPEADREAALAATVEAMKADAAPSEPETEAAQADPEPEAEEEPEQEQEPDAPEIEDDEPEATDPEPDAADEADEADGEADDGEQEAPAIDAVVSGIVTEAAVAPPKSPRRGRRAR